MRRSITAVSLMLGLSACIAHAQDAQNAPSSIGLTIYSNADPASFNPQQFIAQQRMGHNPNFAWQVPGFGVVRDTRTLDLNEGINTINFTGVAEFIDPTTVSLVDLSVAPDQQERNGIRVVEQNFQFDLVSPDKLFDKYIDQTITINVNLGDGQREQITGKLLSHNQGRLVLQTDAGLRVVSATADVQLGTLPEGLITRPTLQWRLFAPQAGQRQVRTAYQTDGITWRADYNLVLNDDDTRADLGAWVTIMNLTGARYPDAELKLIAGDVQRIAQQPPRPMALYARGQVEMADAAAGFEEKSFFEYHMYTLGRPATIENNATQQLALFPTVQGVEVEKVLVYYGLDARQWSFRTPATDRNLGQQSNKKVDVYIRFENREENNLGIPLPKGKMRVYKLDRPANAQNGNGSLEFVGEDLIDHTSRNEQVLVKIGQAFDVVGERVQTDFRVDTRAHLIEETIRITLKNAKDVEQKVVVRENLFRWVNWEIVEKSDDFEKIDSRTIHFDVIVPPEGEKVVTYKVRYTW